MGWIFACFGEIQAINNFAEKVGRPKCQFSLPMLPPKEDIGLFFCISLPLEFTENITIELLVVKSFTLLCKVPSKVS